MSAISFSNVGDGLSRAGAFITITSSWTITGWLQPFTDTPTAGNYRTFFNYGDATFATSYIWLGMGSGGTVVAETYDGTTFIDTAGATAANGVHHSWALVYNSGAHTLAFYFDNALIDTKSVNFSTFVFGSTTQYAGTDGSPTWSNLSVAQIRMWQVAKAQANLRQEWASATVVSSSSLLAATPLTGPADLSDTSGNGRNWSSVGSAGSSVSGPYAANGTSGTATDFGSLAGGAVTLTQRCDVGGIVPNVFFKYTATANGMLSMWMYGETDIYRPFYQVFLSPVTATPYMALGGAGSTHALCPPTQWPIRSGETYVLEANNINTISSSPANLTVRLELFTPSTAAIPVESIAINDDTGRVNRGDGTTDTYPLSIHSTTANATPLKYVPSFPTGETGDCLADGTSCVGGDDDNTFKKWIFIYDASFNLVTSTDLSATITSNMQNGGIRACRPVGKFYLLFQRTGFHPRIATISAAGALIATSSDITANTSSVAAMVPSNDGTFAYFLDQHATAAVKRWDLINDVALTDLVSIPGAIFGYDMLCLSDGSIVFQLLGSVNEIRRYSDTGVLLNTYTAASLGVDYINVNLDSRLAQSSDGTKFWYRNLSNEDANGYLGSYFLKIDAATGVVEKRILSTPFSIGEGLSDVTTPSGYPTTGFFGHSESCTFWILPGIATTAPIEQVPIALPFAPLAPCNPQSQVTGGGKGHFGCNVGGVGWVSAYSGPYGSAAIHVNPTDGETLTNKPGVDAWIDLVHTDYPTGVITTYRRALTDLGHPASYEGGRKAEGLVAIGSVDHGLSNEQGAFEASAVDIQYADQVDRLVRDLMDTQDLENDEVRIKLCSNAGQVALVPPRIVQRAVVQTPKLASSMQATLTAVDALFADYGPFGPNRIWPPLIPQINGFTTPSDVLAQALPWIYGEKSDEGAKDPATNKPLSKGLCPLIYLGQELLTYTGIPTGTPPAGALTLDPSLPSSGANWTLAPLDEGYGTFNSANNLGNNPTNIVYAWLLVKSGTTGNFLLSASGTVRLDSTTWYVPPVDPTHLFGATASWSPVPDPSHVVTGYRLYLANAADFNPFGTSGSATRAMYIDHDPPSLAFAVLSTTGNFVAGETVTIAGRTVTFDGGGGPNDNPAVGATTLESLGNLRRCYDYNPDWVGFVNNGALQLWATAINYGPGSALNTLETCANASWGGTTFFGGDTIPLSSTATDWTVGTSALSTIPTTPGTITAIWDAYLVAAHPVYRVINVYGSNLQNGDATATPDRVLLNPNTRSDIMVPAWPGATSAVWPFANTYRAYTGADGKVYWWTIVYARGPLSDAHKNGSINLTANVIGVEDVGNGTGLPIIDAHPAEQHWIENALLNEWTSGLWATNAIGTFPAWEDGIPQVRSSSFVTRQAFTATMLGGRGLTVGWYVDKSQNLSAWFQEWNASTESRLGVNGHGQVFVWGLDETADPSTWPRIDHVVDIFGPVTRAVGQERQNSITGSCDWDPDASRFRAGPGTYTSATGIQKYKGHTKAATVDSTIMNDATQYAWVLQRRLTRLQYGSALIQITGGVGFLDYDAGTGIQLTTFEGVGGAGYINRPCLILRRQLDLASFLVTYTLLDLYGLVAETLFLITDTVSHQPFITDVPSLEPVIRV